MKIKTNIFKNAWEKSIYAQRQPEVSITTRNQILLKEAEYDERKKLKQVPEVITFDLGTVYDNSNSKYIYNGYKIDFKGEQSFSLGKIHNQSNRNYL